MAENGEGKSGGVTAWLGALAGLVSGAAAVAGLFMAKPDLITVVVPVNTLERVVERAQESPSAPASAGQKPTATQQDGPVSAPPPVVLPPQSLQGNLSATLASLANTPTALVVNLRIANAGAAPVQIAGRYVGTQLGDFSLSDALGGSCPWSRMGATRSLGTLNTATGQFSLGQLMNAANYTSVGPGQTVSVTLLFSKDVCTTPISGTQPVTVSGTFVIVEGNEARFASASFTDVQPNQAQ